MSRANAAAAAGKQKEDSKLDILTLSYDELKHATGNFSEKLGEGGFGNVYRGNLRGTEVAVKLLSVKGDARHEKAFRHEVDILRKLKHQHLVRLLGACPERYAIVYEFVPGGNLEDQLVKKKLLWLRRLHIAIEICDALVFLHSAKPIVVHADVKPENVLLDGSGRIKLGDFGISRRMPVSNSTTTIHHTTDPKGSPGYMDLAFLQSGKLAPSADVYSFGMLLFRLLTKKHPKHELISIVQESLKMRNLKDLLDNAAGWPYQLAKEISELACKCCDFPVKGRPNISEVRASLKKMEREFSHLNSRPANLDFSSSSKIEFSYLELQRATSNFGEASKLGEVVFGEMYWGKLRDHKVAIHILFSSDGAPPRKAFLQQVGVLDSLKHPHIIPLMGTCIEKYCLVYECTLEGTLAARLTRKDLPWQDRLRIAIEICSGIKFLHEKKPDVKFCGNFPPKDVLLDTSGRSMLYNFTAHGKAMMPSYWFGSLLLHLLAGMDLTLLLATADQFRSANMFGTLLDHSAKWPSGLAKNLFDLARRCRNNSAEGSSTIAGVLDELNKMKKS